MLSFEKFGEALKEILTLYDIKNVDIAGALKTKSPLISMVLSGKRTFTPEQYQKLLVFLSNTISRDEVEVLNHLYYDAKMGNYIPMGAIRPTREGIDPDNVVSTVGEKMLLKSFRALNEEAQIEVLRVARQKEIDMLDLMAKLAGVEESQAPYKAVPRKVSAGEKSPRKCSKRDKS